MTGRRTGPGSAEGGGGGASTRGEPPLRDRIATYVRSLALEEIPPAVRERAKAHLAYHIALGLRGSSSEEADRAAAMARDWCQGAPASSVIGGDMRLGPPEAAFVNAARIRATGLDDVLLPSGVHAGVVVVPAALALAEALARPGRELLASIVIGYDVIGKLGDTVWAWAADAPRRPTIAFGPFGPAAAAARLLGLDARRTAEAIGYAANLAMGLAEGGLPDQYYGLVARNGMLAAHLAARGGTTAPTALEGDLGFFRTFFGGIPAGLEASVGSLGHRFEIENATAKRYPGTALNIVPIELMLDAVRRYGLSAERVRSVTVFLPAQRSNFREGHAPGPFPSRSRAASSVIFQLAIALLDGRIEHRRYADVGDPDVLDTAGKIRVELEPGHGVTYARLELEMEDGGRHTLEGEGIVLPPTDWPGMLRREGRRLPEVERLIEMIRRLEALPDAALLGEALRIA
ncbi:MAG TPA: MmgE/PrpD family protein [Actinomycetota bacterium]|nr:MmgE/PrpD family protein [Actinomycetota bacterium]